MSLNQTKHDILGNKKEIDNSNHINIKTVLLWDSSILLINFPTESSLKIIRYKNKYSMYFRMFRHFRSEIMACVFLQVVYSL